MAQRDVTLVVKKREIPGGLIPDSVLMGELLANLFDGKLFLSGTTGGSFEYSNQSSVFEVGSKLFNSRVENRLNINDNLIISGNTGLISTYNGVTGADLSGTFLSGTSYGYVIANIADIIGVDSYLTGATWSPDILTLYSNNGRPNVNVTIDTFSSITANNLIATGVTTLNITSATTFSAGTLVSGSTNLYQIFSQIGQEVVGIQNGLNTYTGGTPTQPTINVSALTINTLTVSGSSVFTGGLLATTISGGTIYSGSTDLYSIFATNSSILNTAVQPGSNITTGGTAIQPIINLAASPSVNAFTASGVTLINSTLTVVGDTSLQKIIATAITDSSLIVTQIAYAGVGGLLKSDHGLTYNDSTDTLNAQNFTVGSASLSGNVTIWGNVAIMGQSISAFTSHLYIEDNVVELNYNPTGGTSTTSIGAGWTIQDGNGIEAGDVNLFIEPMNNLSGITSGQTPNLSEYTGSIGYSNRGWVTQLNDIVIRSTDPTIPSGVRVLGEWDELQGGSF